MLKNAIAYILRKRNRTIIVFIILTVVLSCLYSCMNITKSTNNLCPELNVICRTHRFPAFGACFLVPRFDMATPAIKA